MAGGARSRAAARRRLQRQWVRTLEAAWQAVKNLTYPFTGSCASGVAMIGWVHEQLAGKVPEPLRVPGAKVGTTLNIGGPICSRVVTVQRPAL